MNFLQAPNVKFKILIVKEFIILFIIIKITFDHA